MLCSVHHAYAVLLLCWFVLCYACSMSMLCLCYAGYMLCRLKTRYGTAGDGAGFYGLGHYRASAQGQRARTVIAPGDTVTATYRRGSLVFSIGAGAGAQCTWAIGTGGLHGHNTLHFAVRSESPGEEISIVEL